MTKPKTIEGEVVGETITGRLVKREPERQLPVRAKPHKVTQVDIDFILKHIDTQDIEERLLDSYAGGFVGLAYEEPEEPKDTPVKPPGVLILTDAKGDIEE
jgi:hypothetical protein